MNCRYCGKPTNGKILVWGKGDIDYCGSEECKKKAVEGNE